MIYDTINDARTVAGNGGGTILAGRYRVVRQLGAGGMGSVWLAEDTQLDNKQFAVKMLPSILVANKRAYRQLKDEALVARRLVHPNIVQIRAFEENNGNPFLVMDYIDGETLDDYLAEHTWTTGVPSVVNAPAARSTSRTGGSPVASGRTGTTGVPPVANAPAARFAQYTGSCDFWYNNAQPWGWITRKSSSTAATLSGRRIPGRGDMRAGTSSAYSWG